jgi:DhnA family fructose-bisphosphate aldolase class Ia
MMLTQSTQLFPEDGRLVLIAMDHGTVLGSLEGLDDPGSLYATVAPWADAALVSYGSYARYGGQLDSTPAFLRCDGGWSPLHGPGFGQFKPLFDVRDAQDLGAAGVACMAFFGDEQSEETLVNLAHLASSARVAGLPVLGEVLFSREPSIQERCHAVRIAAELGTDIVKTEHPGDNDDFARICEAAGVPVLILGGPRHETPADTLHLVADAVAAGGAGVAFGRNVWQQPDPGAWAKALAAVIHEGVAPGEALKLATGGG